MGYVPLNNRPLWRLGVLNTDDDGNILLAGLHSRTTPPPPFSNTPHYSDSIWAAKLAENGTIIWTKEISFAAPDGMINNVADIHNFMQVPSEDKYIFTLARINAGYIRAYTFLTIDDSPQPFYLNYFEGLLHGTIDISFYMLGLSLNGSLMPGISIIRKKDDSGYYFVCSAADMTSWLQSNYITKGIYYGSLPPVPGSETWGKGYFIPRDNNDYRDTLLMDNGGLRIREAGNGDLLILKKASTLESNNAIPFLMRTNNFGDSIWTHFYTYLSNHTFDTIINQNLNDMAIAPDGRIVLGGAITSKKAQPGIFDTVGSISWLMVLDDREHDSTSGIRQISGMKTSEFRLSPNPVSDLLQLEWETADHEKGEVIIINSVGKKVGQQIIHDGKNRISTQGFASGVYFVQIFQNEKMIYRQKITKK